MTESPSPGSRLVITLALLGGILIGIFAGAALLDWQREITFLAKLSESAMAASICGGLIGPAATGVATLIATRYVANIPKEEALKYKIAIYKAINNSIKDIYKYINENDKLDIIDDMEILYRIKMIKSYMTANPFVAASQNIGIIPLHDCLVVENRINSFIEYYEQKTVNGYFAHEDGYVVKTKIFYKIKDIPSEIDSLIEIVSNYLGSKL